MRSMVLPRGLSSTMYWSCGQPVTIRAIAARAKGRIFFINKDSFMLNFLKATALHLFQARFPRERDQKNSHNFRADLDSIRAFCHLSRKQSRVCRGRQTTARRSEKERIAPYV